MKERVKKARTTLATKPSATLIGGVLLGGLIAALAPRGSGETKLLRPLGQKLRRTAREAAEAARDQGQEHLDKMGLNREAAASQMGNLAAKFGEVVRAAGAAAAEAARAQRNR